MGVKNTDGNVQFELMADSSSDNSLPENSAGSNYDNNCQIPNTAKSNSRIVSPGSTLELAESTLSMSEVSQISTDQQQDNVRGRSLDILKEGNRCRASSKSVARAHCHIKSLLKSFSKDANYKDIKDDTTLSFLTQDSSNCDNNEPANPRDPVIIDNYSAAEQLGKTKMRAIRSASHLRKERSRSPSLRKLRLFPTLASLVSGGCSKTNNSDDIPSQDSELLEAQNYFSLNNSAEMISINNTHRPSNSTIASSRSTESTFSVESPDRGNVITETKPYSQISSATIWNSKDVISNDSISIVDPLDTDQRLRHWKLPISPGNRSSKSKPCFIRIYKADGTFGTISCPIDTNAERLLQLVARKFFISDISEYHLVVLFPNRVRNLLPTCKPVLFIRNLLVLAGYDSNDESLNEITREDVSFLCRVVLVKISEPLRPPLLSKSKKELYLTGTDLIDAPNLSNSELEQVETLDLSRSGFQGTSLEFPNLKHLKLCHTSVSNGATLTMMIPNFNNLLNNLTSLNLSGNGFNALYDLNILKAPNLRHLDLRGNNLVSLPCGVSQLQYLETLYCGTNSFTEYSCWNPSLKKIDVSYNMIKELKLSREESLRMVNLECLKLCANTLNSFPESFALLPKLRELDIRHNMISNLMDHLPINLQRLVATYNNPRFLDHYDSFSNVYNIKALKRGLSIPHADELILAGLHSLMFYEKVSLANVTVLDLRNTQLPLIHDSLFRDAPKLQVLNLSHNTLTYLPHSITELQFLEELLVADNLLNELPPNFLKLPELRIVDLHSNNLKSVPPETFQASRLRILNLASNLLTSLPSMPVVSCPLVQLVLTDNQLTEDSLDVVLQLTSLQILDFGYNLLTEFPAGLFWQLPSLEELYLGGNRIPSLPNEDFINATQLRIFHVNANKLHTLPAEISKASKLEVFDAGANQLRYNVANWPFDWNWRCNKKLKYLNLSSNKRFEISRSMKYINDEIGTVDLADFCVLPNLKTLGLMDVTLTTNSIPYQSHTCRVRTFGSEISTRFSLGIADSLGFRPLANNDLVIEKFRNREDESLVALFDGHNELPGRGNKISHLVQEMFASILKRELNMDNIKPEEALKKAFLSTHREIGNVALLSPEEIAHTALNHICNTASTLEPADWSSGTGATVLYFKGNTLYVATTGGARVLLSRSNGTHCVLSKPLPPVGDELDRIRRSGGIIDPSNAYINGASIYPRIIGCYEAGTIFTALPSIYEYDMTAFDQSSQIIVANATLWDVMRHETAADIARSCAHDPVLSAMKLRDFANSYGCRDRMMVMVIGKTQDVSNSSAAGRHSSASDIYDDGSVSSRKSRQALPEDSTLARLGSEVSPPFGDVTMVFTDIKSSTYLWENYPSVMRAAIKTHNSLMRRSIRLMDGYEVKNEGDAFIVSFHSPAKALIWCLTVQTHLLTAEWPPKLLEVDGCKPVCDSNDVLIFRGLSVRMGIHCGRPMAEPDPVTRRMDYFGPMVNRASRISGIARGGQISVSSDFLNNLKHDLDAHKKVLKGVPIEEAYYFTTLTNATLLERSAEVLEHTKYVVKELGELKLRGIENPEHIYNVYPALLASRQSLYDGGDGNCGAIQGTGEMQQSLSSFSSEQGFSENADFDEPKPTSLRSSINQLYPNVSPEPHYSEVSGKSGGDVIDTLSHKASVASAGASIDDLMSDAQCVSCSHDLAKPSLFRERFGGSVQEVTRSVPTGSVGSMGTFGGGDSLQSLAIRLEAVCNAVSGGLNLIEAQNALMLVEPSIVEGSDVAIAARPLWITRIENSIARLQQLNNWP